MMTLRNMRQIGLRTLAPLLFVASLLAESYKLSHFRKRIWISRVPLRAERKWVLTQKVPQSKAPRL